MQVVSDVLVMVVALEALFIMVLEMFLTQTKVARQAFDLPAAYLAQREARVSMANQGLYNGFIGVGLLVSLWGLPAELGRFNLYLFVGFVVVAAIYGACTASKKILLTQGLPAILALGALVLAGR